MNEWRVVKRRIGRAGGRGRREAQQREWDRTYGEGLWAIGYVIEGAFVLQKDALKSVYERSERGNRAFPVPAGSERR